MLGGGSFALIQSFVAPALGLIQEELGVSLAHPTYREVADLPLGTPPPPPAEGGVHTFATFQSDGVTPVAYDPCRPVHYVVRPDAAPPGGEALVH